MSSLISLILSNGIRASVMGPKVAVEHMKKISDERLRVFRKMVRFDMLEMKEAQLMKGKLVVEKRVHENVTLASSGEPRVKDPGKFSPITTLSMESQGGDRILPLSPLISSNLHPALSSDIKYDEETRGLTLKSLKLDSAHKVFDIMFDKNVALEFKDQEVLIYDKEAPVTNLGSTDQSVVYSSPYSRKTLSFNNQQSHGIRGTRVEYFDLNPLINTTVMEDVEIGVSWSVMLVTKQTWEMEILELKDKLQGMKSGPDSVDILAISQRGGQQGNWITKWCMVDNGVYSKLISVMRKKNQTRMAMWLFSVRKNRGCRPDAIDCKAHITIHLHILEAKALEEARGADILAALDLAILDGVEVLSLYLDEIPFQNLFWRFNSPLVAVLKHLGHVNAEVVVDEEEIHCHQTLQNLVDSTSYAGGEFSYDEISFQFQDGTSELDVSLTELLEENFNNPKVNYSGLNSWSRNERFYGSNSLENRRGSLLLADLKRRIDESSQEMFDMIFNGLTIPVCDLMMDPFGISVFQSLEENKNGDQEEKKKWCQPKIVTYKYNILLRVFAQCGKVDKVNALFKNLDMSLVSPGICNFKGVMDAYGKVGMIKELEVVLTRMRSNECKPEINTSNLLIDSDGKLYEQNVVVTHNWSTYAALIRAHSRARYGYNALVIYREIKEKGMSTVIFYNTLLSMCADIGYVDEAFEIFQDKNCRICDLDSWTFSSLITVYSCSGRVSEAKASLLQMREAGFKPTLFVMASVIQCYGKAKQVDDVVRKFDQVLELDITSDDRFCGYLLNVMNQTPSEEIGKLIGCVEKAKPRLGLVEKMLVEKQNYKEGMFKKEASELIDSIGYDVKKAYLNCLIDLCVNLNKLERSCEILQLRLEIGHLFWSPIEIFYLVVLTSEKSISRGSLDKSLCLDERLIRASFEIITGHGKVRQSMKGERNLKLTLRTRCLQNRIVLIGLVAHV